MVLVLPERDVECFNPILVQFKQRLAVLEDHLRERFNPILVQFKQKEILALVMQENVSILS